MKKHGDEAIKQMREAIKRYAGPVKKCPPGKARAPVEVVVFKNESVEWLKQNRTARPIRDKKATRRNMRMARAKRQRIVERNATLFNRVGGRRKAD